MTWRIGLLALTAIAALVVSPWPYLTPDAVNYLSIARNLANRGELARLGESQVFHGPGYPVLLAPVFWISAEPWLAISIVNAGLLALFGGLAYRWAKDNTPDAAVYVGLLTVVNVIVTTIFRRPLSETVFCSGLFALAISYNRVLQGTFPGRLWPALIAGQCGLALVRQMGAIAGFGVAAAVTVQAIRGERRWSSALAVGFLTCVPPAIVVVSWTLYDNARAAEFSNADFLATQSSSAAIADWPLHPLTRRLAEGLRVRISEAGQITIPGLFKSYAAPECWLDANTFVYVPYFALLLVGWRRLLRTNDVMAWIWPLYFLAHVYWPFYQSARFTAPLAPVLFVFLWRALDSWPGRRGPLFASLIAAHFAVSLGVYAAADGRKAREQWWHWPELRDVARQARMSQEQVFVDANAIDLRLSLQFLIDRPVLTTNEGSAGIVVTWDDERKAKVVSRESR
jgi:hypothetical protein